MRIFIVKSPDSYDFHVGVALVAVLGGCGREQVPAPVGPVVVPVVLSVTPTASATAVPVATLITATFNEAMNPATVSGSTFTVAGPGGAPVTGTVSFSGNTATFTPAALLAGNTQYTATISGTVTDANGIPWEAILSGTSRPARFQRCYLLTR